MTGCWNYTEQACPTGSACHYPLQCALAEQHRESEMPRMSKLDEFTVGVKARLSQMGAKSKLSSLDLIVIRGCFHHMVDVSTETERQQLAVRYISALHTLN